MIGDVIFLSIQDELEHFKQLEGVTTANKWFLPLVWAAKMISQATDKDAENYKELPEMVT